MNMINKPPFLMDGIYEMRIFKGNGYRVYYAQEGEAIYLLLIGGSKDNQQSDINKANLYGNNFEPNRSNPMTVQISRFDVADYLDGEELINAYLNEFLTDGTQWAVVWHLDFYYFTVINLIHQNKKLIKNKPVILFIQ